MKTANSPSASYERELSDFRLGYSKAGGITAIVLVLAGFGLDYFTYPERLVEFTLLRVLVVIMTLGILRILFTDFGRQHVRSLTMLWLVLPQIMIAYMIYTTDGAQSIYFVGLYSAMYAVGILLPISFAESVGFGILTVTLYVLACVFHKNAQDHSSALITNTLLTLFSAGASAVCTWFNERARLQLFSLQHEVSEKNAELVSTNKALAEIKGHMMQQEKMAALGTLAAGLLHEVNNPVNYSLMALNMAQMDAAPLGSEMLKESLADAKEGMQRVQGIVTDLKTFAYQKPGDDASRIFLFEKALKSALRLTGFELKGIEVSTNLPMDSHVHGDEPAVIGVLINLLGNAALALQKSGRKAAKISVHAERVDARLHVAVRDNGTGITPENLLRVFEPFFTTREVGKGLGLGLSVSYAIINRHGGELRVASEPSEWTEFTFDLRLANLNA